jgi:hypothetical protein
MNASLMRTETFQQPYHAVYNWCLNVLSKNGFEIKEQDSIKGYITASKNASLLSFGEDVEIAVHPINDTNTQVNVQSFSKGIQIFDWGTNDENERLIMEGLTLQLRR